MGQYFLVVNEDKEEYLYPHCLGDGLKLLEFGCSSMGTMTALTLLLRKSDGSGGGDFHGDHPIVGTWAGDRIVIVGDYDSSKLFQKADELFKNISHQVREAMVQDEYVKESMEEAGGFHCSCDKAR